MFLIITLWVFIAHMLLFVLLGNYRYVVVNTTTNIFYFITHFWKYFKARKEKKKIGNKNFTLDELNVFLKTMFTYTSEGWDWRPWVITLFMRNLHDDCDGVAAFIKWKTKRLGWKPEFWSLFGLGWGHAVCRFTVNGKEYVADRKGVKTFLSWVVNFPSATKTIKRWY